MKQKTLYISGMHCPACDLLIREVIKETAGIELVLLASSGVLVCSYSDDVHIDCLKESIAINGYTVSDSGHTNKKTSRKEGVLLFLCGIVIWLILDTVDISSYAAGLGTTGTLGYGEMFLLGGIASLSTCLALVGGFVLMRGSLQGESDISFYAAFRHQSLFQLGRLSGYALGGALLGFLGSSIIFSPSVNGIINLVVSMLLLLMGWNMLDIFSAKMPIWGGGNHLMYMIKDFSQKKRGGIVVGALTFFLPCGFTQVAQINAMSTGSSMQGALLLFVFALGTMPVLLTLGLTGNRFQSHQFGIGYKLLGVFLIVLSYFLIQNSFRLLGW